MTNEYKHNIESYTQEILKYVGTLGYAKIDMLAGVKGSLSFTKTNIEIPKGHTFMILGGEMENIETRLGDLHRTSYIATVFLLYETMIVQASFFVDKNSHPSNVIVDNPLFKILQ